MTPGEKKAICGEFPDYFSVDAQNGAMEVMGFYTPLEDQLSLAGKQYVSTESLITERVGDPELQMGAFSLLGSFIESADRFDYYYNLDDGQEAELVFAYQDGELVDSNPDLLDRLREDVVLERQTINDFLEGDSNRLDPEYARWVKDTYDQFEETLDHAYFPDDDLTPEMDL